MATKNKIETPGATNHELDTAKQNVSTIENNAKNIDEAIAQNQAIINNTNASADDKARARLAIESLLEAKSFIDSAMESSKNALEAVKSQAQQQAATVRQTDLTNVTITPRATNTIEGKGIRLTPEGYVIDEDGGE